MAAAVGTAANTAQNNRRNRRDGGLIIAANDGDGDGLIDVGAEVIGDACGVGLGDGLAFFESLGGGEGVVEGVGPDACEGVDGDGAVGSGRSVLDRPGLCGAGVDVGGCESAGGGAGASDRCAVVLVASFR